MPPAVPRALMLGVLLASGVSLRAAGSPEFTYHRGWLHVSGYSHHFEAPDTNSKIFGGGFTWYSARSGNLITSWTADVYQDSARKLSAQVGRSWTLPLRWGSLGTTVAAMYHRNFKAHNPLSVMPVLLPFVETRGYRYKLRIYYVPPVRRRSDHQVALQLLTPVWR